jgi:hypothetical protein
LQSYCDRTGVDAIDGVRAAGGSVIGGVIGDRLGRDDP